MTGCLLGYSLLENHFYELRLRQSPSSYPKIAIVVWTFLIEAYYPRKNGWTCVQGVRY